MIIQSGSQAIISFYKAAAATFAVVLSIVLLILFKYPFFFAEGIDTGTPIPFSIWAAVSSADGFGSFAFALYFRLRPAVSGQVACLAAVVAIDLGHVSITNSLARIPCCCRVRRPLSFTFARLLSSHGLAAEGIEWLITGKTQRTELHGNRNFSHLLG